MLLDPLVGLGGPHADEWIRIILKFLQPRDGQAPGDANGVRHALEELRAQWQRALASLDDDALRSSEHTRWPFQGRAFGDVIAWANVELIKNAAELGYARFAYAVRER